MNRSSSTTAAIFVVSGLFIAVGGEMHPRGAGATVDAFLASMLVSPIWFAAHALSLIGLIIGVVGLVLAHRNNVFGESVRPWLALASVGWNIAVFELIPHVLAVSDLNNLLNQAPTPLISLHLALQMFATPALGLSTALLAVAVARSAQSFAAWALAVVAVIGGVAYSFVGPAINLTMNVAFAPLFATNVLIAIWTLGTGIRLALRRNPAPVPVEAA